MLLWNAYKTTYRNEKSSLTLNRITTCA